MINFHFKLLVYQTIFYTLLYFVFYLENSLTIVGKIYWKPMVILFYIISVLVTFIIPIIKIIKKK